MREMIFKNRIEAAELLAEKLENYRGKSPVVLGIPRGAMPMARLISDKLGGDLDVVLVHKISAPLQPELAIGSVGVSGEAYLYPNIEEWGISEDYIQTEIENQLKLLKQRRKDYDLAEKGPELAGRTVIVVDDGIATGSTMMGAVHEARMGQPGKVIVAAAVASVEAAERLEEAADEVVLLDKPEEFWAVGQFFQDFSQVTDKEAIQCLKGVRQEMAPESPNDRPHSL